MIWGIDVSHHNGEVDWWKVKQSGARFAFCKASEGIGYVDPMFKRNWVRMRLAGITRGAYHFARISKSPTIEADAISEATHFCDTVGELSNGDLPLVLDIEWDKRFTSIGNTTSRPKMAVAWTHAFLETVEELSGIRPFVYTGYSYWRYRLKSSQRMIAYHLWLAQYNSGDKPKRPIPGWPASIWQHTNRARVDGVKGNVDRNIFMGTHNELLRLCYYRDCQTRL